MIRFQPDTLRDALWRPLSMAAPDAGVYVEIMAPDLRFAALALLTVACAVFAWRRGAQRPQVWLLAAFLWAEFTVWVVTTGNGRYFIAGLLLVGPACIALIWQLPLTAGFRLTLAALLAGLQLFALSQINPWNSWGLAAWSKPYFPIALGPQERATPTTYVTVSSISYSLMAPQFDERSRWMSLASLRGDPENAVDDRRAQAFLRKAAALGQEIKVIAPTLPDYMDADRQPSESVRSEIDRILGPHALAVKRGATCRMVESRGLASLALRKLDEVKPEKLAKFGFWICPLSYPVPRPAAPPPSELSPKAEEAFARIERSCPRMFHPGEASSVRMQDGFARTYPSSDMKAYVLDNGDVLYKYWRGLNPGRIGTVDQVLADGFQMDCNSIIGRSGLPWERKL